jgi:hypothetical protein
MRVGDYVADTHTNLKGGKSGVPKHHTYRPASERGSPRNPQETTVTRTRTAVGDRMARAPERNKGLQKHRSKPQA